MQKILQIFKEPHFPQKWVLFVIAYRNCQDYRTSYIATRPCSSGFFFNPYFLLTFLQCIMHLIYNQTCVHQCGAQFMYRFITLSTLLLLKEDTNETPVLAGSHSRTAIRCAQLLKDISLLNLHQGRH